MSAGYLVVDLGGVVCHFDHARRLERLARGMRPGHGTDPRTAVVVRLQRRLRSGTLRLRGARARPDPAPVLGFAGSDDDLDDAWCGAFLPDPSVIDVLDRHRGDRALALFTNNGPLEEQALTLRYPDVFARFDHLFFSHRLRHRKPEPAAFTAVAGHLGASGEEIIFIDDSTANVAAARAAGWRCFQYHDVAQVRHDLAAAA